MTDRRAKLAAAVKVVHDRIAAACSAAGRDRGEVTLVAVTKTWPASDAALLLGLGVTDLAENRDAEAREKALAVPGARWHFVGAVQTNKARSVASYAHVVHSVDRDSLCDALAAGARRAPPASASTSASRSTLCTTCAYDATLRALFVCTAPTKCQRTPGT